MSFALLLPQSVCNLIGEFNADHRDLMRNVLDELLFNETICSNCYQDIIQTETRLVHYIMFKRYVFCCDWCLSDGQDYIREEYNREEYIRPKNTFDQNKSLIKFSKLTIK